MPTSNLPVWVFWAQALGLPIFGLVIAGASVYIAWQQKRIADIRLRHELYDRRLRVYEAAKTLLVAHQMNGKLSGDDYIAYLRGTADAVFLLDAGVVEYLKELQKQAVALIGLRAEQADEFAQIETWLMQQFDILIAKFKPAMRLDQGC